MKKMFLSVLACALSVFVSAEEMKFVTTLSQPVGSFARVEAVNADRPARALQVNFCNQKVSSGNISVNGAVRAAYLKLDNSGSLGGNVPVYQLKTLNLGSGKDFQGGNVWANEANPAKIKADGTLYGKDMSYLVAELPALKIKSGTSVQDNIKSGGPTGEELEWGAQYTCDYAEIYVPADGADSDGFVTTSFTAAAYKGETVTGQDTCYDGRPYSHRYLDEFSKSSAADYTKYPCTDWKMSYGYTGQTTSVSGTFKDCLSAAPAQGGTTDYVTVNMAGEYSVFWSRFLGIYLQDYVTSVSDFNCAMGGEANTYFACKLPNGTIAYQCAWAEKRTVDKQFVSKVTCTGNENKYSSYVLKNR